MHFQFFQISLYNAETNERELREIQKQEIKRTHSSTDSNDPNASRYTAFKNESC